jgi:hypothetical protein
MRTDLLGSLAAAIVAVAGCASMTWAQTPAAVIDPHDLNGIWGRQGGGAGAQAKGDARGMMPDGGVLTEWGPSAPLTPKGLAQVNANKPGKGPRAIPPALGNDLIGDANPPGLLRALVYGRPFQLIVLPDKVVQLFEWSRVWREIWTDGRKMPDDPGPLWYGYSVGAWQSDTLVVDTIGLDARAWMDEWGTPFTDSAKIQERWHRANKDTLELTLRIEDPTYYTTPWETTKRTFRFQTKDMPDGEMLEVVFAPVDEKQFNERIRNPAAGVK